MSETEKCIIAILMASTKFAKRCLKRSLTETDQFEKGLLIGTAQGHMDVCKVLKGEFLDDHKEQE